MTPTRGRRSRVVHSGGAVLAACAIVMAAPAPAVAELAFFSNGRSMSVSGHRVEGEQLVFQLRGGGEMSVDRSLVEAILPDEVPYPVPTPATVGADVASTDEGRPAATALPTAPAHVERLIEQVAGEHGVDAALVRAVVAVESGFQSRARSAKGAVGLMQVLPSTARQYGIRNLYDPGSNLQAGVRHLKGLLDRFPLALALAAYNAGEGAVQQFRGIPPYPETRAYVARVRDLLGR